MGKERGSITVMMSLVGLLILAMLGTCLETARYTTCAGSGAEMLRTGTDALLTEYSRPLYDHYGLFFLEGTGKPYEQVISGYVNDGLENKSLITDFLGGEMTGLEIHEKTLAGDDGARPLAEEITSYMERYMTSEALGKFVKKISKLSDTEKTAESIDKTAEEEEEDTKLDDRILRLMELVDGVKLSRSGHVSVSQYFVKKFATQKPVKGVAFGVSQQTVWNAMKKRIDKNPVDWKETGSAFLSKLRKVIDKTKAAIEEGDRLKRDYMSAKHSELADRVVAGLPSLRSNLRVLEKTEKLLTGPDKKDLKKELKNIWKDYDTASLSFDYSGVDEAGGDDSSPLDALGGALGDGLLHLVCEKPDNLSKKAIKDADRYAKYYKEEEEESTDFSDRMKKLADDEKVELSGTMGSVGSYAMEEFTLDSYITKMFPSYIQKVEDTFPDKNNENKKHDDPDSVNKSDGKWKRALEYGWEYVVAGKRSDKDNLESVLARILVLRTVTNLTAIMSDGAKRAEAYAAAAAVVGFTGLVFLIKFTQMLILVVWAYVESLTDVAALLLERDVPMIKTAKQVKTTFPEVFLINNSAIISRAKKYNKSGSVSFGYKEYLLLFMAMTYAKTRRYRVMDLIENDMKKNGYKNFSLGACAFDMTIEGTFRFPVRFFTLPGITGMLNRDLSSYQYLCRVRAGYL